MYKFDVSWRHQHYRPIQQHARRRRNPSGPSACPGSTPNTRQIWPHPSRAGHPTPAPVATTAAGGRADGGPSEAAGESGPPLRGLLFGAAAAAASGLVHVADGGRIVERSGDPGPAAAYGPLPVS